VKFTIFGLIIAVAAALLFLSGEQRAEPAGEIRFGLEKTTLSVDTLIDAGASIPINGGLKNIKVNKTFARSGSASLEVRLKPGETRAEAKIASIPNNSTRIAGFSVYFPADFKPPEHWSVFAQWWQGRDVSPSIAFELDDTDNSKLAMRIISRAGNKKSNRYTTHYTGELPRERWIDFTVEFRIDDTGGQNGLLRVYRNGELIVNYSGKLGYTDQLSVTGFRIGLYRSARNMTDARLYFDDIFVRPPQ